jgi:chromosomal replication initiator protein
MTFSARVWGDVLRRLRQDMPDFVYEAWIAPLDAKAADGRLLLGCPTSFHRDRILRHHLPPIELALAEVLASQADGATAHPARAVPIEVMTAGEFARADGVRLESRAAMRSVAAAERVRVANAPTSSDRIAPIARPRSSPEERLADPEPEDAPGANAESAAAPSPRRLRAVPGPVARKSESPVRNDAIAPGMQGERWPLPSAPREPRTQRGPDFDLDGRPRERKRPLHSFERFVVGPCNALAREAALALARRRQASLNLLYVAGPAGMGKTHLARATVDEASRQLPDTRRRSAATPAREPSAEPTGGGRILYTTAEQFTSEFVSAVRNGRNEAWTRQYRGRIDLIVVEDVQLLSGRTKTQQELFHTLSHVLDAGGRVLLTGDRTPRDLTSLDARLRALAGRGFIAELARPDAIVRRHLFREKAAAAGVSLPPACLELLVDATESESLGASVVELESLLVQIVMTASLAHRPIDLQLVREAIALKAGTAATRAPRPLEVTEVVKTVAGFFGARPEALASRSRRRDVLIPRQLAMYLAHRYTDASLTEIGRALGRDHPSVKNAIQKIEDQVLKNAPLRYQVEALSERIDALLEASGTGSGSAD